MSARHLPKMDAFGTCDPFCEVRFCGQARRTPTLRGTYSPDWNAPLRFQVPCARLATPLDLVVYDADLLGRELVGTHAVPAEFMQALAARPGGWHCTRECPLQSTRAAPVLGNDGQPAAVTLAFRVLGGQSLQVPGPEARPAPPAPPAPRSPAPQPYLAPLGLSLSSCEWPGRSSRPV